MQAESGYTEVKTKCVMYLFMKAAKYHFWISNAHSSVKFEVHIAIPPNNNLQQVSWNIDISHGTVLMDEHILLKLCYFPCSALMFHK